MEEGKAKAGYVEQLSGKNIVLQWDMDMVWVLQDWRNDARPVSCLSIIRARRYNKYLSWIDQEKNSDQKPHR